MKFASCRVTGGGFLVNLFSREYNKSVFEKSVKITFEEGADFFRDFDYIDLVVPGSEILYFSRNYPPVKPSYIRKIVVQDIEVETTFKENDLAIDMKNFPGFTETSVFCAKKESVKNILEIFDTSTREKIRSIVPEEILFFKAPEKAAKAIFIGDSYSLLVSKNGQIVRSGGLDDLMLDVRSCFSGDDSQAEFNSWLSVARAIDAPEGLSDLELLVRKCVVKFFEKTFSMFAPFSGAPEETIVFINDFTVPGTERLVESMESSHYSESPFIVYGPGDSLEMVPEIVDNDSSVSFAAGEFAYKGGFSFLKRRIILGVVFYLIAFLMLAAGMQIRINYLDERIEKGEERTKTLMKDVIGKEMPSLRQAISIMDKTIKGETSAADKKAVYPYSAIYIMEVIFPYFTFEGSTIEVSELAIKEEGKIRVTGTSDTLEDINKFTGFLDDDPLIDEINRGQINTRNDKSSFNISFSYAGPKKEDSKGKKTKKKSSSQDTESEL